METVEDSWKQSKLNVKLSYTEHHKNIIFTYLNYFIMRETNLQLEDVEKIVSNLGSEYSFNIYSKMINLFDLIENMNVADAREAAKKFFEGLASEIKILDLKKLDDMNMEEEARKDTKMMLSLDHITWKLINVVNVSYYGELDNYEGSKKLSKEALQERLKRENVSDLLETVLVKDRFFQKTSMVFPLRFAVLGGSNEIQLMVQNIGTLFEVSQFAHS